MYISATQQDVTDPVQLVSPRHRLHPVAHTVRQLPASPLRPNALAADLTSGDEEVAMRFFPTQSRRNVLTAETQGSVPVANSLSFIKSVTAIVLQQPLWADRLDPLLEGISLLLTLASRQLQTPVQRSGVSFLLDAWLTSDRKDLQRLWLRLMEIVVETSEADQRAEDEDLLRDIKGLFALPFQV